jgi:hypothetical protein
MIKLDLIVLPTKNSIDIYIYSMYVIDKLKQK